MTSPSRFTTPLLRRLVPPSVRRTVHRFRQRSRQVVGRVIDLDRESTRQLLPPDYLHNVGVADFATVGNNYLTLLTSVGGLRPDDRIVDIGSGTGRIARPLTRFLTTGRYDGLEIVADSVRWCRRAYRPHSRFRFHHADVRNSVYNRSGRYAAHEYRLPFADGAFSYAILTSVFTHMLPREVERYLSEIARVLEPGGRVFATFFLLDADSRSCLARGAASITFDHEAPGCRLHLAHTPEAAVAYDEGDVLTLCARAGLSVTRVCHGAWSGRADGFDWQDVVLLQRV